MVLNIYQIDAFASKIFEGNPAAVVPLKHWLEDETMQKIAMENNLSETAFFVKNSPLNLPTGDLVGYPANMSTSIEKRSFKKTLGYREAPPLEGLGEASYHLRWFTPEYEIDLCGHATLASAYAIKNFIEPHVAEINFTTQKAGLLKASAKEGLYTLDFPSRQPQPAETPEKLLKALGISTAVEVLRSRDYFVVLPDEDAVRNIEPDFQAMSELDTIGVIVTAKGKSADVVSRCFYPGAGIPEDPVTGSAHCNIVPYWSERLSKTKLHCRQLSSRGGDLQCELKKDRVLMTGTCQLYLRGEIII